MFAFGVVSLKQLRRTGHSQKDIDDALAAGDLVRIHRGWFAVADANPDVVAAIQCRGRVGCLSGAALHGVWTTGVQGVHVLAGSKHKAGLPPGMIWRPWEGAQPETAIFPLADCLDQIVHRHDTETALISLESAVNQKLVTLSAARRILSDAPARKLAGLGLFNPASQSGSETRVRLFFARKGVAVRPQVPISGLGRVDLLVGESRIIECDSQRHHTAQPDYERDRRRDLAAAQLGYKTLRLSFSQIFGSWDETQAVLEDIIRTRNHRNPPLRAGIRHQLPNSVS